MKSSYIEITLLSFKYFQNFMEAFKWTQHCKHEILLEDCLSYLPEIWYFPYQTK